MKHRLTSPFLENLQLSINISGNFPFHTPCFSSVVHKTLEKKVLIILLLSILSGSLFDSSEVVAVGVLPSSASAAFAFWCSVNCLTTSSTNLYKVFYFSCCSCLVEQVGFASMYLHLVQEDFFRPPEVLSGEGVVRNHLVRQVHPRHVLVLNNTSGLADLLHNPSIPAFSF